MKVDMTWEVFKENLLKLPKGKTPITIGPEALVLDEKRFVDTHIAVIDSIPKKKDYSNAEKSFRLYVAKPHYDRLAIYYILKTELSGAF